MQKPPSHSSEPVDPEKHDDLVASRRNSDLSEPIVDHALERVVWRKLDLWILPVVTMFYFLSFLDRTNFANARVAGLQSNLKMTNKQYSIALTVTYVPYIVAELPSNLLLKIVGPNLMLPTMLTLWGLVTMLQGVVHNYQGLLACRFFLGLLEGGVFPGLVLYLSFFYPRQRLQWRISAFFSAASLSGAFSGLLAFGIINMNGVGNRPGWAWIFILEGLFTLLFGLASYMLLPRSPAHARFFNEKEKAYVISKLKEDGATGRDEQSDRFSWREVGEAFKLPQVWMLAVIFFFDGTVLFGLAYFAPSIVQGLGFTAARAQLMSVPPFAVAFVLTMIFAYISDRFGCRGYTSIFSCTLCVIGFAMFLGSAKHNIQYASLFFSIPGTYIAAPTLSTWSANNAAPHTRRATAIAIGFIMTNSGGILATWLLGSLSLAPRYILATRVLLAFSVLMVVFSILNTWYLWDQNNKKRAIRRTMTIDQEKPGLGDRSAWFIYAL
ncbi:MFS general substrate transporter [Phlegmacium glaucopus]|nr:MFS general substrate transporter [Phlegmacium glaucopus]